MCMVDYSEAVVILSETMPTARKAHQCGECRREIQPGEQYEKMTGIWEGEMETYKTCAHCVSARDWLQQVCNGWVYGSVGEDLYEHFLEGYGIWLARAWLNIKRKWIRRDGSLAAPMQLPDDLPVGF